ncbi:MAG: ABC transporter permease subunit, partial [Hyphomicrobiales bacterium]
VLIWQRLSSFGPNVLHEVAVIAVLLSIIAIVTIALQIKLLAKTRAPMIGPPQPPLMIDLGKKRYLVELFLSLLVLATFVLPATALMATALVKTYGLPLNAETLTFSHFAEILFRQSATLRAFFNSTITAGVAGLLIALMCVIVAHFLHSKSGKGQFVGKIISTLAETTYAVPGLVISIAFILVYIKPIPFLNMSIYNTLLLIGLAYICAFFSIALKPINAATAQLDPALDEAARVSGATFGLRLRRIFIPAIAPAAASGVILVFLTAYNEVTVSALLWSSGNETIGTAIYNYEDGGYTTLASAMSAITVAATVVLMFALDRFGRHLPQGVIPWRV